MPNSTTAPKTHPIATTNQTSDIDIHDLPHPEIPSTNRTPATPNMNNPTCVVNSSEMYSGFTANMYSAIANGRSARTRAEADPRR